MTLLGMFVCVILCWCLCKCTVSHVFDIDRYASPLPFWQVTEIFTRILKVKTYYVSIMVYY